MLTCKVGFKQNVDHLGRSAVVMGVHGNFMTMKIKWRQQWDAFWDRLAQKIIEMGVEVMAGDFNMSLTQVVPQLRSRGLFIDCIAWYPWFHATESCHGSPLGFDSCAMFYIGGTVQVQLNYSLNDLAALTQVVGPRSVAAVAEQLGLEVYAG